jgi:pyruvate/2-oxoglutarate dehydrogenase complex dihydrolipoamide acyltransferase (E2) component
MNAQPFTYSAKSAAIRAAKKSGLEPAEYTIKQTDDGRFAIHKIAALEPAAYAAPAHNTTADRGAAAAKQDDAARLKEITEGRVGNTITAGRIKRFADQRAAAPAPATRPQEAPTPAPDLADIFGINKPNAKHRAILQAAQGGARPKAPDLSAPAHDYYRRFLIAMEAAIAKGDLAGMQAICDRMRSKIYCSSRTRIRAYGLLSIIAMRAKQ